MQRTLIASGLALPLFGCGIYGTNQGAAEVADAAAPDRNAERDVWISQACGPGAGDPVVLSGASLTGEILTVTATYPGGCHRHDFAVCWSGGFGDARPVQAQLRLVHDAHGDTCDAYESEQLHIDLQVLGSTFLSVFPSDQTHGTGTIEVYLDDQHVTYQFP